MTDAAQFKVNPPTLKEIRLSNLHAKWVKGTASDKNIAELLENSVLTPADVEAKQPKKKSGRPRKLTAGFPASINGMDSLGGLIMRRFPGIGIQVQRQVIQNWRRLEHVPDGCNVPFPAPRASNRYDVAECFAWVSNYFPDGEQRGPLAAKQKTRDAIEDRKLKLLDIEVGKAEGALISRDRARMTRRDALTRQNNIMQARLEHVECQQRIDWLKQLGATPELIAEFQRRDSALAIQTISEIYNEYQSQSRLEPESELAEEMKQKTVKI